MRHLAYRGFGLLGALGIALASCATPAERADREARRLGLQREDVHGEAFQHATYAPARLRPRQGTPGSSPGPLHVYIGGDGSPRGALRWKPPDPTPEPLMLRLMSLDPAPRIYLGRPCYHGASRCSTWLLTLGRYSEEVVASMAAALERIREPGRPLVLIGHSGGGTIAMLLAARLDGVLAVVTLAGNLDLRAWAQLHEFEPLSGSLDPARAPPLRPEIAQLHVVGDRDRIVPPDLLRSAAAGQPAARVRILPGLSHEGPWEPVWPAVLDEVGGLLAPSSASPQNWMRAPSVSR